MPCPSQKPKIVTMALHVISWLITHIYRSVSFPRYKDWIHKGEQISHFSNKAKQRDIVSPFKIRIYAFVFDFISAVLKSYSRNRVTYRTVNFVYRYTPRHELRSPLISGTFPWKMWWPGQEGKRTVWISLACCTYSSLSPLKSLVRPVLIANWVETEHGRCGHKCKQWQKLEKAA